MTTPRKSSVQNLCLRAKERAAAKTALHCDKAANAGTSAGETEDVPAFCGKISVQIRKKVLDKAAGSVVEFRLAGE